MDETLPEPSPELSPEQVVRIQLTALQHNDHPTEDSGIRLAFKFASPANRALTGPIERFIRMVKNPLYGPMLNFVSAQFGPVRVQGDEAEQRVTLVNTRGEGSMYRFFLSRQQDAAYKGCWMTNSVVHEGTVMLN